jgi:hypothetical protein
MDSDDCYACSLLEFKNDPRNQSSFFLVSKAFVQYYPLILIACWLPTTIETSTGPDTSTDFHFFATCKRISHGILVGGLYFIKGDQSKKLFWQSLNPW